MTTFVLIPGAGGAGRVYWSEVVAELEARGHAAIAVEIDGADPSAGAARVRRDHRRRDRGPRRHRARGAVDGRLHRPDARQARPRPAHRVRQRDDPAAGRDAERVVRRDPVGRGAPRRERRCRPLGRFRPGRGVPPRHPRTGQGCDGRRGPRAGRHPVRPAVHVHRLAGRPAARRRRGGRPVVPRRVPGAGGEGTTRCRRGRDARRTPRREEPPGRAGRTAGRATSTSPSGWTTRRPRCGGSPPACATTSWADRRRATSGPSATWPCTCAGSTAAFTRTARKQPTGAGAGRLGGTAGRLARAARRGPGRAGRRMAGSVRVAGDVRGRRGHDAVGATRGRRSRRARPARLGPRAGDRPGVPRERARRRTLHRLRRCRCRRPRPRRCRRGLFGPLVDTRVDASPFETFLGLAGRDVRR